MAVRGIRGFCRGIVSERGLRRELEGRLPEILGAPAQARAGQKRLWLFAERRRAALAGPASDFAAHSTGVSGRDLFKGRLRTVDAEVPDVRRSNRRRQQGP